MTKIDTTHTRILLGDYLLPTTTICYCLAGYLRSKPSYISELSYINVDHGRKTIIQCGQHHACCWRKKKTWWNWTKLPLLNDWLSLNTFFQKLDTRKPGRKGDWGRHRAKPAKVAKNAAVLPPNDDPGFGLYKKSVIFFFFFFPRKARVRMILIARQISDNAHPFSVSCCHAHVERNDKKQLVRTFANDRHPRHSSPIHHLAIRWGVQICNTQWSDLWQAAARVNSVPCGFWELFPAM